MAIRLINTETLQMKMFVGASVPPYAILSHTWVDGEEVDFHEMTRYGAATPQETNPAAKRIRKRVVVADSAADEVRRRSGFRKVVETCRLARKKNLGWAWVDTCCIDKSSSAELSEAINSMYKWYENSAICYAFLSDFDPGTEDVTTALQKCRWFTRGWTLQELIAPKDLVFYDRTWGSIGTKLTLLGALKFTGIEWEAMWNGKKYLNTCSVATKMSWASKRQTTRAEDIAYCLLGIFGINMPLLYGEGDRAFRRLQEEILKRVNDPSIFCSFDDSPGSGRDVLARSPAQFRTKCDVLKHAYDDGPARTSFTMTSKGIFVQTPFLLPFSPPNVGPYYILVVDYWKSEDRDEGKMALMWIAPGRYVRLKDEDALTDPASFANLFDYCGNRTFLTDDIYIMTGDFFDPEMVGGTYYFTGMEPTFHLEPVYPPYHLHVVRPSPSKEWDVANMSFVGQGLGCATVELAMNTAEGSPYLLLARFQLAFIARQKGIWVHLYATDQWKDIEPNFERDVRSNSAASLERWSWFDALEPLGDPSDWLCLGSDLETYRGSGTAPGRIRVKADISPTWSPTIEIEAECLQEDGTYSGDFSKWGKEDPVRRSGVDARAEAGSMHGREKGRWRTQKRIDQSYWWDDRHLNGRAC